MKGFWGRACALVIAGGGVSLAACAHDDSTLFVFDVLAGNASSNGCTFTADPTQPVISGGTLDVGLTPEYAATFLVANQMVTQADPAIPQTESAFITISHANVRITYADGSAIESYSTVTAATVFPATGTTPSFVAVSVPIIDETATGLIKQQKVALIGTAGTGSLVRVETFVKFFGKTTGGTSVESNEFQFPIDVCNGCLVAFPLAEDQPSTATTQFPQPNCYLANATATTSSIPVPCRFGQDAKVDCAICRAEFAICQQQP
jgi:hypothetical protein